MKYSNTILTTQRPNHPLHPDHSSPLAAMTRIHPPHNPPHPGSAADLTQRSMWSERPRYRSVGGPSGQL